MSATRTQADDARELHDRAIVIDALDVSIMNDEHLAQMIAGGITAANACVAVHTNFQRPSSGSPTFAFNCAPGRIGHS